MRRVKRYRESIRNADATMRNFLPIMLVHCVLPLAVSFAAGTYAGGAATASAQKRPNPRPPLSPMPSANVNLRHSVSQRVAATDVDMTAYAREDLASGAVATVDSTSPERPWRRGESTAPLLSRLLFQYATPLMALASQRDLEADDCFDLPSEFKMDRSVSRLGHIYRELQAKSRRPIEVAKLQGGDRAAGSQALLLTKALFLHQRRNLARTGLLRLLNTGVQALPAILVARLLRLIEAGTAEPASRAVGAALTLLAVLTTKMLVENKFFHETVKCSTQVRGALAGLIFDKSLRLPGGGSGVSSNLDASKMSNNGKNKTKADNASFGAGGLINLMQSDASLIESAALQIHTLWDGPLQIAVYTSLLYRYLGPPVFWGIGALLLTIPTNSIVLRILNRLSRLENEARDARTRRTSESITNMKLLKLQAWEENFADDIRQSRTQELKRHVTRGGIRAVNQAISNAVPALVLVVTLTAYIRAGKPLLASTIFTAISLFNQLRFPLFFYPMLIDSLANGKNSIKRISAYLSSEEVVPYVQRFPSTDGTGYIEMTKGNFLWPNPRISQANDTVVAPALLGAELQVGPGEIVAVIGEVGSGKSALVKALLGELSPVPAAIVREALNISSSSPTPTDAFADEPLTIDHPSVLTRGKVAYCSQEAWLPKGTIRDAIVFGRKYDENRYIAAIRDACLDRDMFAVDGGLTHDTDVGEGGSSLSGGQRARVALARALYSDDDTKVFILDDVLAALDANVGSLVFERLTKRLRGSNAATVLVSNDPSIPKRCDKVVLMGKSPSSASCSSIVDVGSYDQLLARGHDLRRTAIIDELVDEDVLTDHEKLPGHSKLENFQVNPPKLMKIRKDTIRVVGDYKAHLNCTGSFCHADPESQLALESCPDLIADHLLPLTTVVEEEPIGIFPASIVVSNITSDIQLRSLGPLPEDEKQVASVAEKSTSIDDTMLTGGVTLAVYSSYLRAVRQPLLIIAMVASYILTNAAMFYQQLTVAKWTKYGAAASTVAAPFMKSLVNATVFISVVLWLRNFLVLKMGVRASEYLHSRMLSSVFAAPMSFFDATESGSLLSRFGKEIEVVDRRVPDSIGATLFCFLQIFMSMGGLASVVTPAMLAPLAIVGTSYAKAMSLFRPAARNLKRVETRTRSPIFTHFGEALRGSEVIRSFQRQDNWSTRHRQLSDINLSVFYTVKALDRWLSTRLETLGNVVVFTAAVASIILTRADRLPAGSAGWGLTQALAITGLLTWAVRCLTDLETDMLSVVRVEELTDIDSEHLDITKSIKQSVKPRLPKEHAAPNEALVPLLPIGSHFNASLASSDSSSLVNEGWPWHGNLQFRNVSMRYSSGSPLVLKGVTIIVPAGTTLGVVGRTGSGKSSLLLTLFRLVEVEPGGAIEVDGVDLRSVGLNQLRKSIAIIPQDPILFAGTVAYNLDATGEASEAAMWEALETASPSLARQFRSSNGLQTSISESGKNLSLGQRQLICLARALLRKCKILVLDEATSSVDAKTDGEVQATIRREFVDKGVTVVTVAHRLDTVLGYDKIAVLGDGQVLECASPEELLRKPGGELRRLVDADRRNKSRGSKVPV